MGKTKKGDEVRCRWVMQDFNDGSGDKNDFYANTPNVAALRCQLAVCSGEMNEVKREEGPSYEEDPFIMVIYDISVAFIHAYSEDDNLFMNPPPEMNVPPEYVLKCEKAIYGWRKAPQRFQEHFAQKMLDECELKRATTDPYMYVDVDETKRRRGRRSGVHVDDGQMIGRKSEVDPTIEMLQRRFKVKIMARLEQPGDQGVILKRTVTLTENGFTVETSGIYTASILKTFTDGRLQS
jgi:hypothetical protein